MDDWSDAMFFDPGFDLDGRIRLATRQKLMQDEAYVRSLLEQWVSEAEPSVCFQAGEIIGLCDAAVPIGVRPFIFTGS